MKTKRQFNMKIFRLLLIMMLFSKISAMAQNQDSIFNATDERMFLSDMSMRKSYYDIDSLGNNNISFFVVGTVELDSLIYVGYEYKMDEGYYHFRKIKQSVINGFITYEKNLPILKACTPEKLNQLYSRTDVFDKVSDVHLIKYLIAPHSPDSIRIMLEQVVRGYSPYDFIKISFENNEMEELQNNSRKGNRVYYQKIKGKNTYLLLIMNRTWVQSKEVWMIDPPREPDTTNRYIKCLIPLYGSFQNFPSKLNQN